MNKAKSKNMTSDLALQVFLLTVNRVQILDKQQHHCKDHKLISAESGLGAGTEG